MPLAIMSRFDVQSINDSGDQKRRNRPSVSY